ncbi:MAG: CpaF family protein [Methanobacteriota archaeon]|nr:MAG: CpaF family protein [Euryarchaeota archaeon]
MKAERGCEEYEREVHEIEEALKDDYKDVFVTGAEEVRKVIEEIKGRLGGRFDEKAIECFVYNRLSMGKLTPYLLDPNLEEVMVIGEGRPVYILNRQGENIATDTYLTEMETRELIQRVAHYSSRVVDTSTPLFDGRLPDGSRVNATYSKVSPKGSTITIRKFGVEPLTVLHLLRFGTMSPKLCAFLWLAVDGLERKPANIMIIGGTASGKTTTLNALSSFIPEDKRIISIEDTLEINLRHKHWVPMETAPPDQEGRNEVTMDALLKNTLRMRPDRIIVGEVRAEEASTLFTAMNTGHDGCLATIHANSAREALSRLQGPPMNVPDMMIPALDLIVAQRRVISEGRIKRLVFEVAEISGKEKDTFLTNTLFSYDPKTGQIESKILNGKIIRELSEFTGLTIKELDDEMYKRELVLELMMDYDLTQKDIHKFVQDYYRNKYATLESLHDEIKSLKDVQKIERENARSEPKKGLLPI